MTPAHTRAHTHTRARARAFPPPPRALSSPAGRDCKSIKGMPPSWDVSRRAYDFDWKALFTETNLNAVCIPNVSSQL